VVITELSLDGRYPSGTLLATRSGFAPRWILGATRVRKSVTIERPVERTPELRWVLIGDDGGHDPRTFLDVALHRRDRAASRVCYAANAC
jgi:phosphatidate phosphatase APP1